MHEKEVWTLLGRKKIFLVDDNNCIIKEIKDIGPLSEQEMKWVKANSGLAYQEWLEKQEELATEDEPESECSE